MENLNIGITLMVIGMSTVFVFLAIMIVAMNITTKVIGIINKYFPEELPPEQKKRTQKSDNDAEIALAIACAVHRGAQAQ